MSARRSTGMPQLDAQYDFLRARRAAIASRVLRRRRRLVTYDEVIAELGLLGERRLGPRVVRLSEIVGTVDRACLFDWRWRPLTARSRARWEMIAVAMRRGEALPPVDLLQVADGYLIRDGHHRVSVARALGRHDIDAIVTELLTVRPPRRNTQLFRAM